MRGHQYFLTEARHSIEYFRALLEEQGLECWRSGLDASLLWLAFLESEPPVERVEEIIEFYRTLQAKRHDHGSGWHNLLAQVRVWLYENGFESRIPEWY